MTQAGILHREDEFLVLIIEGVLPFVALRFKTGVRCAKDAA